MILTSGNLDALFIYCLHAIKQKSYSKPALYLHCFRYQFVPQIIFLNSLFGYLSLLIIVKWVTGSKADLYHVMIYMFLSPMDDLEDNQLFMGQKYLQVSPTYPNLVLFVAVNRIVSDLTVFSRLSYCF